MDKDSVLGSAAPTARSGRPVTILVGAAGAVVATLGLHLASDVVGPVLLALMLTVAVLPIGHWSDSRGWPRWVGVLLTTAGAYLILVIVVGGVALSVAKLVSILPNYTSRAGQLGDELVAKLHSLGVNTGSAKDAVSKVDLNSVIHVLKGVLGGVLHTFGLLFLVVTLLLFMCSDTLRLSRSRGALRRANPAAMQVLRNFTVGTQRYLIVSAIFGAIVGVLDSAALWLMGIPLALVWGLLSFLTNFIPNIGFVLGVIPPALVALLDQGWTAMLGVIVVYSVLNVVIQTFIQPRYVGDTVGLNATTTMIALTFWGLVLGPLGALLAIPATLLVRAIFIDGRPDKRWVTALIGSAEQSRAAAPGAA
jgi:predicted PurR-regulated permease PerM